MKKIIALTALVLMSAGSFAQSGPLPMFSSPQGGGGMPNPNMMPTVPPGYAGPGGGMQPPMMGEQPANYQFAAANCYDRNYVGPNFGPIQANGQPLPNPGAQYHGP